MSAGVAYLIRRSPEARGVLDTATETARKVYCTEKSVSMTEAYQARAEGFNPEIRLKLTQRFEWKGEDICLYKGTRYKIIRPYSDEKADGAELTLERERGNAAAPDTSSVADATPGSNEGSTGSFAHQGEGNETAQGEPAATGETAENESAPGEGGEEP